MNERSALFDLEPYRIIRNDDVTNDVSRPDIGKIHVKFDQRKNLFVLFFYDEEKKIVNLKLQKIRNEREIISLLVEKKHIFDRELFLEKFKNFLRQLPDEDITNATKLYVQKLEELSEIEIDDDVDSVQIEELSSLRNKIIENLNNSGYGYQEKFTFDPSSIHGHEVLMERMHDLSLHILKLKEENENFEMYFEALGFEKEIRSKIISYLTNTSNSKPNAENNLAREILNESIESNFVPEEGCKDLESVIRELNFDEDFKKQIKSSCLKIETRRKEFKKKLNFISLARQPNVLSDLNSLISIVDLTNEIATGGNRLRLTQIVAILVFLNDKRGKAHISEISTGEGKTTVISCLAAIKVLQGYNVHVITSNNVLAEEAIKDRQKFYQLLAISVSHNIDLNKSEKGTKTCYHSQVVYGSMANFQFDWLRHNAKQQGTMGSTDYDKTWVILDEIDSLIIDQGSHIARLSQQFPGMDCLRYVYINIWMRLEEKERQVYDNLCKKLEIKAQELREAKIDNVLKQKEFDGYKKNLTEKAFDKIRKKLIEEKSSLIDTKIVPGYLLGYAQKYLDNWIECAYKAKYFVDENVEYKIIEQDGKHKIIPVDNQNTGVSMPDSIYSNLLHQFLQLKHNLKLTAESLNSCFISNIGYVKKYSNKLFGVTGTVGSENEQRFLKKIYDLNFSKIPTYKT
ncbi:pre translocase subunit, partial [Brachionus plicatilis]